MARALINVPATAKKGDIVEIKALIAHPMETGFRFDVNGAPIPKNVVSELVCRYNGEEVFRAELGSGVAANPYLQFHAVAEASGSFVVEKIFQIPGLGFYFVDSVVSRDYPVLTGLLVFYVAFLVLLNLAVDILYGVIDPRTRDAR